MRLRLTRVQDAARKLRSGQRRFRTVTLSDRQPSHDISASSSSWIGCRSKTAARRAPSGMLSPDTTMLRPVGSAPVEDDTVTGYASWSRSERTAPYYLARDSNELR